MAREIDLLERQALGVVSDPAVRLRSGLARPMAPASEGIG